MAPTTLWVIPVAELGGVARHVLDVARAGLTGWRLVVLCPEGALAEQLRALGTAVVTGPFGPDAGARASLATLRRAIRALRPTVVHSHLSYADVIASAAVATEREIALVTTEHGIADNDIVYHGSVWRSRVKAELHAQRVKRADAIIAVAQATRDAMLRKWHPYRNIEIIPNGVDRPGARASRAEHVATDERHTAPRILSLSRLAPEKRLDQLLRAFALVRAARPNARLTIAGTGPLEDELRGLVSELGLDDAVDFPGYVDAASALAHADVLVQLSVWENCSYTLLDAVAAGVGVVATPVGGNPEIVGPAFLADADDLEAVAERILAQLDDATLRPRLDADWPSVADMCARIVGVYGNLPAVERRHGLASSPEAPGSGIPGDPPSAPRDEIVIATNNGDIGGGEVMLLAIAGALRDLGHAVRVVGPTEPSALVDRAGGEGFAVTPLKASSRREWMLALRRWAQRGDYRVLWCNGLVPAAATAGLPRRLVHLHKTADGRGQQLLARVARPGALATLVPSAFMANEFPGATVLANWSREFDVVRRPPPSGRVRIGVVARLSRIKGVDLLAQAVERLVADGRDVELVVAGEPTFVEQADRAPVDAALARLGERATRRGRVDVAAFLAEVDLLVVPSIVRESFGLTAVEAMASGVPVVVSDAGALPEVVGDDYPWVFRAGELDDAVRVIARALDGLPSDPTPVSARRRWEQHFSPEEGRRRVAALMNELASALPSQEEARP